MTYMNICMNRCIIYFFFMVGSFAIVNDDKTRVRLFVVRSELEISLFRNLRKEKVLLSSYEMLRELHTVFSSQPAFCFDYK